MEIFLVVTCCVVVLWLILRAVVNMAANVSQEDNIDYPVTEWHGTICVDRSKAEELDRFCQTIPGSLFAKDEVLFDEEFYFDCGDYRMVVQVIAVGDGSEEPCWTQGVLYDARGNELAVTPVQDRFLQTFEIEYDGCTYSVNVVAE